MTIFFVDARTQSTTPLLNCSLNDVLIELGAYSRTQVVRTIRLQSYDARRNYDTTYSQNESQIVIVLYVRHFRE